MKRTRCTKKNEEAERMTFEKDRMGMNNIHREEEERKKNARGLINVTNFGFMAYII